MYSVLYQIVRVLSEYLYREIVQMFFYQGNVENNYVLQAEGFDLRICPFKMCTFATHGKIEKSELLFYRIVATKTLQKNCSMNVLLYRD